ncbi:MAG: nuclear transport factor 2 family protein [Caldilineaceae bacterium]
MSEDDLEEDRWASGAKEVILRLETMGGFDMAGDERIRECLDELLNAFNDHDLDRIMNMFSDNCTLEMPRGPEPWGARSEGKEAVRQGLAARFQGIPDVHYEGRGHYVDGNTGISKWTLTGTTTDGQKIEVRGCDFYEFNGDLVMFKDSYWKIVV